MERMIEIRKIPENFEPSEIRKIEIRKIPKNFEPSGTKNKKILLICRKLSRLKTQKNPPRLFSTRYTVLENSILISELKSSIISSILGQRIYDVEKDFSKYGFLFA